MTPNRARELRRIIYESRSPVAITSAMDELVAAASQSPPPMNEGFTIREPITSVVVERVAHMLHLSIMGDSDKWDNLSAQNQNAWRATARNVLRALCDAPLTFGDSR